MKLTLTLILLMLVMGVSGQSKQPKPQQYMLLDCYSSQMSKRYIYISYRVDLSDNSTSFGYMVLSFDDYPTYEQLEKSAKEYCEGQTKAEAKKVLLLCVSEISHEFYNKLFPKH